MSGIDRKQDDADNGQKDRQVLLEDGTQEDPDAFGSSDAGFTEPIVPSAADAAVASGKPDSSYCNLPGEDVSKMSTTGYNHSDPDHKDDDLHDSMMPDFPSETTANFRQKTSELRDVTSGIKSPPEDDENSSGSDGDEQVMAPLLRSFSMTPGRLKTRLQDPPPLTPALQRQLTHCRSRKTTVPSNNPDEHRKHASPEDERSNAHVCSSGSSEKNADGDDPASGNSNSVPNNDVVAALEDSENMDDDIIPAKKKKLKENKCLVYLQLVILVLLIAFLVCSYKLEILSKEMFLGFHLWRWDALTLVVFCGHLLSGWIVKLLAMLIERHYVLKKRVLYFVYGLRKSVKNCVWLALVLGVWESIHQGHEDILLVNIVTKILWCLFTASVSWMLKILAVKVAANSFHRKAYFERIQESVFNQHLLEILTAPPRMVDTAVVSGPIVRKQSKNKRNKKIQFSEEQLQAGQSSPQKAAPFARKASIKNESPGFTTVEVGELPVPVSSDVHMPNRPVPLIARSPIPIAQNKLQELTADNVSVWTLKSLMKVVRKTNISTYSSMLSHEAKDGEISNESQAKGAAKQIFYNMARPGQKTLIMKDFLRFLPEDQAMRAFSLFEVTESGEITKQALAKWVISVYKERRALALTLNDSRTVVAKLHKVLDVVLILALIIVFLLIFGIETSKLLVFFSSVFIPSVFVFGNSARSTFEALIFLFVIHPFDVGDRVVVDGQSMIVEEMNVLNTVFLGSTSEKIYYPNSILTQKSITNYYRSPDQGDAIDFQVHMKTPVEKLGMLKERIQRYIESLPQCWYPDFRIICDKIHDCNKVNLMVWIRHRINYQDIGERFQRRSNLLLYLKQQLEDLNIGYQLPNQEILVTGIPLLKMP